MSDEFIREMQEDLRNEQLRRLWDRYGKTISAVALAALVSAAGYTVWKHHSESKAQEDTFALSKAITESNLGKRDEAAEKLSALSKEATTGVKTLATFRHADDFIKSGKVKEAFDLYVGAANDSSLDVGLRDYAAIQAAMIALDAGDKVDTKDLNFLNSATAKDRPYQHIARELQAQQLAKTGKYKEAREALTSLLSDEGTAFSQRERIEDILSTLPTN